MPVEAAAGDLTHRDGTCFGQLDELGVWRQLGCLGLNLGHLTL